MSQWESAVALLAITVGVFIAWWQIHHLRKASAIQRVIDMHSELTSGEVGLARNRLGTLMWAVGEAQNPGFCYQPTFADLLGSAWLITGDETGSAEVASTYRSVDETALPMQDLYKILWEFERISAASDASLLDKRLKNELIGPHAVWWDTLLLQVQNGDTLHRASLRRLADEARQCRPELISWAESDFVTKLN